MKMRISMMLALSALAFGASAQKHVSILGDSYSTFDKCVSPSWNAVWYYPTESPNVKENDVLLPEQTWWSLLLEDPELVLERNNSFSGATICCTGYRGEDYSDRAFLTRMHDLGNPDIVILFGGTNDSWAGAPIGEYKYSGQTHQQLYQFRPAFAYLLAGLKRLYPNAQIINVTNSELKPEITDSMAEICRYYGIENVQLVDVDKQKGHPSQAGMQSIMRQVKAAIAQSR